MEKKRKGKKNPDKIKMIRESRRGILKSYLKLNTNGLKIFRKIIKGLFTYTKILFERINFPKFCINKCKCINLVMLIAAFIYMRVPIRIIYNRLSSSCTIRCNINKLHCSTLSITKGCSYIILKAIFRG